MNFMDFLINSGYISKINSGLQFDLNTVLQKNENGYSEGYLCDHNCTSDYGCYSCPAAFSCNKNSETKSLMKIDDIKKGLKIAERGLKLMNEEFLEKIFPSYVKKFKIPGEAAKFLFETLSEGQSELNLFGGNPELHPKFTEIIKIAKMMGFRVTATTTGKKFLHDAQFLKKFKADPPHLLAISTDDFDSVSDLKTLLASSLTKHKAYWQKVNPLYGQRKKAYESLYIAKMSKSFREFCPLLFNMVIHPGNLNYINKLICVLHEEFPQVLINPYPAQSSFMGGGAVWETEHMIKLEKFVDFMIKKQLEQSKTGKKIFVPRLQYWLLLKSAFTDEKNKEKQTMILSGFGLWKCYGVSGAGRYFQAGSSIKREEKPFKVGGHPGCFWNNHCCTDVTKQLWTMTKEEVKNYLLTDKIKIGSKSKNPCRGCFMPRLMFDGITTELGMNERFLPAYLKLRKKYYGF